MDRREIIDLIVRKAHEHNLIPWEFLGGAIAESALDPQARRPRDPAQDAAYWPDVSFGLFQQTARWADEGDQSPRPDNIRYIQELYFDPVHACNVAARKFGPLRRTEATALDAWCRYNWPAKDPAQNPNRGNYADGLAEAQRILGTAPMVTFNPNEPNIQQNDPWSCAPTSARWSLKAVGRNPSEQWIEDTMLAEGVVTKEHGLMDASGAGLAAFLKRHYGEFGYDANHEPSVTFEWCAAEGDHAYPVMIGGRGWNHWSALRGFDAATGRLWLMNPSPNWMGVRDHLDKPTFDALGPFSAVRLWHADLLQPAPPPPPPAPDPLLAVRAKLLEAVALVDEIMAGR